MTSSGMRLSPFSMVRQRTSSWSLDRLIQVLPAQVVQERRRVAFELEGDDVAAQGILEPGRRIQGHELAVVHDGDAAAEEVGLLHVVGGEDDRHAGLRLSFRMYSQMWRRVWASRPRVGSSRKRTFGRWVRPRAISRRRFMPPEYFSTSVAALSVELDERQDLVDAAAPLGLADAVHHGVEFEVLAAGQLAVEGGLLEDDADALADAVAVAGHVEAGDRGAPRGRPQEGREHVDGRRLARPVGAEQAEELPFADGKDMPSTAVKPSNVFTRFSTRMASTGLSFGVPMILLFGAKKRRGRL